MSANWNYQLLAIIHRMAEQIFLERGRIKVTSARAIFDDQTYALSGITSVRGVKHRGLLAKACYLLALGSVIVMFVKGGAAYFYMPVFIAGLVYLAEKILSQYVIVFSSASGEAKAYSSRDEGHIGDIVKAINDAIVHRG